MKKAHFLLLLCFVIANTAIFAQKSGSSSPRNVIKINPFSFIGRNLSLSYERALGNHFSVQLQGGYFLQNRLPQAWVDKIWKGDASAAVKVEEPYFWGYTITPEVRWYFLPMQRSPKGLYLAAYLRHYQYGMRMNGSFTYQDPPPLPPTNHTAEVVIKASYFSFKPGLQLGYQFLLGDRVSLDMFLGGNVGGGGVQFSLYSDVIQDRYDALIDDVKAQIQFPGLFSLLEKPIYKAIDKLLPQQNLSTLRAGTGFTDGMIRGGLTLGVAF
ncbi:MAG: DUF3575 domain-containing protein [Bacteroidia bacterium]